jgi:hypothetical protein
MTDVNKLKEEELLQLNEKENVEFEEEVFSLEELILLGDDKRIPIIIEYPLPDGSRVVKSRAYVKQLTIKELDNIKVTDENMIKSSMLILQKAMFKENGELYSRNELGVLPIGVIKTVADKILALSGMDSETEKK